MLFPFHWSVRLLVSAAMPGFSSVETRLVTSCCRQHKGTSILTDACTLLATTNTDPQTVCTNPI